MSKDNIAKKIQSLYKEPLEEKDLAFIFLDYAAVICRSKYGTVGFDLAQNMDAEAATAVEELDLLFISHTHYDHFKESTVKKLFKKTNATIIVEPDVASELEGKIPEEIEILAQKRLSLRKDGKYEESDNVRKEIEKKGYIVKDTPDGGYLLEDK